MMEKIAIYKQQLCKRKRQTKEYEATESCNLLNIFYIGMKIDSSCEKTNVKSSERLYTHHKCGLVLGSSDPKIQLIFLFLNENISPPFFPK